MEKEKEVLKVSGMKFSLRDAKVRRPDNEWPPELVRRHMKLVRKLLKERKVH